MIFLKFTLEKNPFKVIGLFMVLIFGLSTFYIYSKAYAEGTTWVALETKQEIYQLQPMKDSKSYLKEDSDYYFILLEGEEEPLKIEKENATIANSNDTHKNKVIKETTLWLSTKADNEYSFLSKDGETEYRTFYHIYLDY